MTANDVPRFALYLRPFENDGKFSVRPSGSLWELIDRPGKDLLERAFNDALSKSFPLLGLGQQSNEAGRPGTAGFVHDWKILITKAIRRAEVILIIPSNNEGTLWEIGEIKRLERLARTIFIMPPTNSKILYEGQGAYSSKWEATKKACEEAYRLTLPRYSPDGKLFLMHESGSSEKEIKIELEPRSLAKYIKNVLGE